jgi:hypothetical protein
MFLTNFEIISLCKSYKVPLDGVLMRNELNFLKHDGNYVINLDSSDGQGSHWTALVIRGNDYLYFDSFGCVPPTEVETYLGGSKVRYAFNNWICQDLQSTNCGFFCVALFIFLNIHSGSLYDLSNKFINIFEDNTKLNDTVLQNFYIQQKLNNKIVSKKLLLRK